MIAAAPTSVATLIDERRQAFMIQVYQHVGLALVAFVVAETLLFATGAAEALFELFFVNGSGGTLLLLLGGVMIVNWFAAQATADLNNPSRQYAGLFAVAAGQAVIFAPFLFYVFEDQGTAPVRNAAVITGIGFAALSAVGLTTAKDLSFLRPLIMWGFALALVAIVAAALFGTSLGTWFSVAMIGLAGGAILHQTQSALRTYPEGAHVAAAVGLFASIMTMFWYVLRLTTRR